MTVTFPPEVEEKVLAAAAQNGLAPDAYVRAVVEQEVSARLAAEADADADPDALTRAVAALSHRTPEQIKAAQTRATKRISTETRTASEYFPAGNHASDPRQ